ncbi:hypothetical protein UFOVP51_56 [uncultured Caudovirales phage]|jgi:hypothetical protein|uniref:Uncharacterized protein n=1 Tax=uncultured Caudovirales phage TaxID=2100421 RepID=A0A6J5T8F6_9CAUD|nr:hypothetical protein UFOVP51_56 [uncultured Caudovirales phage]CAB4240960.1 hypothetical protein UFOVP34_50 [uncultured Caudovirales phage]
MLVVYPEYIDLKNWAGALIADNPSSYLPILQDESKWQEWAAIVAGTGVFQRNRVPSPFSIYKGSRKENFKDWTEWAKVVYLLLNNESKNNEV